jgi:hypothetical protein
VNWPEYVSLYGEDATQRDADGSYLRSRPCVRSGAALAAIHARIEDRAKALACAA